jgi:transcriptional regulator with XRE-family HTH domain
MNDGPVDAPNFITPAAVDWEPTDWSMNQDQDEAVDWLTDRQADPDVGPRPRVPTTEERFGQAILRLRLYRGWTQRDVQRACGVHQSQISRLEAGRSRGLSMRRVYAILRVLHAERIEFMPPAPAFPPTALELMLRGDLWERAGRAAERRRLSRRRSA